MKKNYVIYLVAILFSGIMIAQETQKKFINYQGVARSGADQLMANEAMTIGIALKMGSATGAAAYAENHAVVTDANGVFSLKIGNGDAVSGAYTTIPWGSEATFVTVLVNGSEIGTTEMMAVPYALSSGDANPSASDVPYDNGVSGLAATNAQEAIDELVGSGAVDADADPNNEFQTLSFDAVTNELSLTDGNSVVIPSGGTDADADPTNELQTISFDVATNEISLTDGGTITIPSGGTDADADPTNELQNISLSGTDLSISEGSTIDLSAIIPPGGTDDQNAAEVPFDNTISGLAATDTQAAIEELAAAGVVDSDDQNLSLSGTLLQISDGTGVDLAPIIPPGGTDDQNADEVPYDNTVSGLAATDAQAAIDELATAGGSGGLLWTENDGSVFRENGNVGIGVNSSTNTKLYVLSSNSGGRDGIYSYAFHPGYKTAISAHSLSRDDGLTFGTRSSTTSESTGSAFAYRADMNGAGTGTKYGFYSRIHSGTGGEKYGMYTDGEDKNYFSGAIGVGTEIPTAELDVDGSIRARDLSGTGQRNVMADADGTLVIGAGGGASSLWSENGSDINYNTGNVGIGNTSPGVEPGAGKYLTVATGTSPSDNSFASIEIQGGQGSSSRPVVGRLDFISNSAPGNSAIGRVESRTSGGAQFRGDLAFSTKNGSNYAASSLEERMTIKYDGDVGIGTVNPTAKLDVNGDIKTSGEIHGPATGASNMIPIAYGRIASSGAIVAGSNNFTVTRNVTGRYAIIISGVTAEQSREIALVATRVNFLNPPGFIGGGSGFSGGSPAIIVFTYSIAGEPENIGFSFTAYEQ